MQLKFLDIMRKFLCSVIACSSMVISAWSVDLNYPKKKINGKQYYEYVVQKSEGFYSISKKFGVTEEEIKSVNPGTENGLTLNATILIPVKADSYITHVVDKKETLYSLSKKYDVTYDDLYALNPSLKTDGLKYGTEIKIPTKKTITGQNMTVSDTLPKVKKETKPSFVIREVKKGETLYGICREYGITSEEIIRLNPDVKDGVKVGQKLIIPPVHANTALTENSVENKVPKTFKYHNVKKGETLFSICQEYGVSQEEVLRLNPKAADGLKANMVLIIPPSIDGQQNKDNATQLADAAQVDTVAVDSTPAVVFVPQTTPKKEINMALVLPFQFSKYSETSQIDGNMDKFLEFYQGALLAMDSLRKTGLSFNMNIFDSGESEADMNKLLENRDIEKLDFMMGPAYTGQIKAMSDYTKLHDVKMVIPFSSKSEETVSNPNIFQVNTPLNQLNYLMADLFIKNFSDKNIVLVRFNNSKNDKNEFGDTLAAMLKAQKINFNSVNFSTLSAIRTQLVAHKENIVVPLTSNQVSLSQVLPMINMMNTDKKEVSIFGFSEWQSYPSIAKDLFILNTYIVTPFYTDFEDPQVINYLKQFRKYYNAEPVNSQPQYGMLGYDVVMYLSEAISKYGHDFEHGMNKIRINGLQSHFFFNKFENGGYYNSSFMLMRHNRKDGVVLVGGTVPQEFKPLMDKQTEKAKEKENEKKNK